MDLAALIQNAVSGEVSSGGARMAHFMQMAQFVNTAHPRVVTFDPKADATNLDKQFMELHNLGGVIVSVDFTLGKLLAYMPKEK